jgi:pyruvate/2-oxoglutarate dehydrogenase complex dihydrolipoamide dehydrogenase (E3) component
MRYDAVIIGSGQAGFPLATALADKGWQVALAEGSHLGGTCVNYGCSPTKTIIASARAAHVARRGADFGVQSGPVTVDFGRVMERQRQIVQQFRSGIESRMDSLDNVTVYRAYAQLESAHQVRVGDDVIEAERVYINTGTRTLVPPVDGLEEAGFLDNISILELDTLPEHLLIIGGGYIGLEYAQAFRRLGSEVTVINRGGQLLSREDPDIAALALELLQNEGITVHLNAQARSVERRGAGFSMMIEEDGKGGELTGSHILVAAGRRPNSDRLGLEAAGVETDERGYIRVDDHLQTSAANIWALGDVNGHGAFTHTSYNDYVIALDNLNGGKRALSDRITTYAVYTDPPLARVGMSEQDARASGRKILMGTLPMSSVSRAIERDETHGLIKVLVDADSGQYLGATIFGIGGDEVVHSITGLMYARASHTVMKNAVHIHPTVSELLPTVLQNLKPLT